MLTYQEILNLRAGNRRAVAAQVLLNGYAVEAFRNGSKAVLVVSHALRTRYAELSIDQWQSLSQATDWGALGVGAADDARIVKAALDWIEEREELLAWSRINRGSVTAADPV